MKKDKNIKEQNMKRKNKINAIHVYSYLVMEMVYQILMLLV